MPCAANAANEVANSAFRAGECGFLDIERVISAVMDATHAVGVDNLAQLSEVDARSRQLARSFIRELRP